ncbi:hypothetical protein VB773_01455 [Haloarculaceae archaeon H-GB2-1]|nr:hypothetical protein [Haloarculaceae archaeon H-GB1-1]MEA5406380.1 hypothetical protein [Haloarculaceae archaeon H-GB2-1]
MSTLTSEDFAVEIALVMVGFIAPAAVRYGIEEKAGKDLPDEVYGLTVVVGGAIYGGAGRQAAVGGGIHTLEALRTRFTEDS